MRDSWIIYFIQAGDKGPIKIGKTRSSVACRLATLQTASSRPLRLLATMPSQVRLREQQLHLKFSRYRVQGEWFQPVQELLDFIRYHAVPFGADPGEEPIRSFDVNRGKPDPNLSFAASCELRAILVLQKNGFSRGEIAAALKLSHATLYRRIEKIDTLPAATRQ